MIIKTKSKPPTAPEFHWLESQRWFSVGGAFQMAESCDEQVKKPLGCIVEAANANKHELVIQHLQQLGKSKFPWWQVDYVDRFILSLGWYPYNRVGLDLSNIYRYNFDSLRSRSSKSPPKGINSTSPCVFRFCRCFVVSRSSNCFAWVCCACSAQAWSLQCKGIVSVMLFVISSANH